MKLIIGNKNYSSWSLRGWLACKQSGLAFEEIRWETPANLPQYDFLDGDVDFVKRLSRGRVPLE